MANKEVILTNEGLKHLEKELDHLTKVRRREVADRIKQSIEFGDLSENSEYDDAKNEQAFVEGKIAQLKDMILNAQLIDNRRVHTDKVTVGSVVKIKNVDTGDRFQYLLVGFAEADPDNNRISNESPVGKAVLDKKAGDIVEIEAPSGTVRYKVMSISRNNHKKTKK